MAESNAPSPRTFYLGLVLVIPGSPHEQLLQELFGDLPAEADGATHLVNKLRPITLDNYYPIAMRRFRTTYRGEECTLITSLEADYEGYISLILAEQMLDLLKPGWDPTLEYLGGGIGLCLDGEYLAAAFKSKDLQVDDQSNCGRFLMQISVQLDDEQQPTVSEIELMVPTTENGLFVWPAEMTLIDLIHDSTPTPESLAEALGLLAIEGFCP